jgi:hypothetical protein
MSLIGDKCRIRGECVVFAREGKRSIIVVLNDIVRTRMASLKRKAMKGPRYFWARGWREVGASDR